MKFTRFFILPLFLTSSVGCSQSSSSNFLSSSPPKPDKAASEYVESLTAPHVGDAFWKYDLLFTMAIREIEARLPKEMWASKERDFKDNWLKQIQTQRNNTLINDQPTPCWDIIQPGASVSITEVRPDPTRPDLPNTPTPSDKSKVFAKVKYFDEKQAPIYQAGRSGRFLKEAVVTLSTQTYPELNSNKATTTVTDACQLVWESIAPWPVPKLANDVAKSLALVGLPRQRQFKLVGLYLEPWVNASQDQTIKDWNDMAALSKSLQSFYHAHDFQVEGFQLQTGYYAVGGKVKPPSTWDSYTISPSTYSLNGTTDVEVGDLDQKDELAWANLKLTYQGCTPVCAFMNDLKKEPRIGKYAVTNYTPQDWPKEDQVQVSYQWFPKKGWTFGGAKQ
jgi:hypothetical protein